MIMEQITVIIPFRNEGKEIFRTLEELNRYCNNFKAIVINDASDDNHDYSLLSSMRMVEYVENPENKGVAACRDFGAALAQTPYILFLDAHMHIESDILSRLEEFLKNNPRTLACLQTRIWEGMPPVKRTGENVTRGCRINFTGQKLWMAEWMMLKEEDNNREEIEIPCVMGAAYAIRREYYNYLHGLKGLSGWGGDEQLLSTKVWREGGRCVLLKDIEIGHWYRAAFPYQVAGNTLLRNRIVLTKLLAPELLPELAATRPQEVGKIMCALPEKDILEEWCYLQGIFKKDMSYIYGINNYKLGF